MPIAPCVGWLLLTVASAQEPAIARPPTSATQPAIRSAQPAALQVTATAADRRSASHAQPDDAAFASGQPPDAEPPGPKDPKFSVPEAQTLLLVGGALVLVALAKRRVRVGPIPLVR